MKSMKFRGRWTDAVALAVLTVVVAVAPVSSAAAGPDPNPFAGTYGSGSRTVTISNNGQVRSSSEEGSTKFSLSGRVDADGTYAFTVNVTEPNLEHGPRDKRVWLRYSYELTGSMTKDSDGNIVATPDSGGTFTWFIQ